MHHECVEALQPTSFPNYVSATLLRTASKTRQIAKKHTSSSMVCETFKWAPMTLVLAAATEDPITQLKSQYISEDGFHISKYQSYWTKEGKMTMLHCSGRGRYNCPYEVKVLVSRNESLAPKLFERGLHEHSELKENLCGIPLHQKLKIEEGVQSNKRPREIFEYILGDSPATKTNLQQVQRAANRLRKQLMSALETETVGDLRKYLQERELHVKKRKP